MKNKDHIKDHQSCDFGIKLNPHKNLPTYHDPAIAEERISRERGKKPHKPPQPPPPPPPSGADQVIFLDFDGYTVTGTSWNVGGVPIVCTPANLSLDQQLSIYQAVVDHYAPFNVTVTTDEAVYNAGNPSARIRCIITESWEWYCGASPCAGGVSYVGSFFQTGSVNFVFSSALHYNIHVISIATCHEVGHSIGLYHHPIWSADCTTILNQYDPGQGGIGPIMGAPYQQPIFDWEDKPDTHCCTCIQKDYTILSQKLGLKV